LLFIRTRNSRKTTPSWAQPDPRDDDSDATAKTSFFVAVHCLDSVSQVQRFAQGILWETGAAARVAG
jgi:hypothetical protein